MATPKRQFNIRLSVKDAASLRKIAKAEERSLSDAVRAMIRHRRLMMVGAAK
jgi:hypothetical protein